MATPQYDWTKAVWDSIPAYNLTKEIVDSFLQDIFGYIDFLTTVCVLNNPRPGTQWKDYSLGIFLVAFNGPFPILDSSKIDGSICPHLGFARGALNSRG